MLMLPHCPETLLQHGEGFVLLWTSCMTSRLSAAQHCAKPEAGETGGAGDPLPPSTGNPGVVAAGE